MTSRERFEAYMKSQGCEIDGYGLLIWQAAERDMLDRAIAKFEAEGDPFYAKPYINMLKELLNEQH